MIIYIINNIIIYIKNQKGKYELNTYKHIFNDKNKYSIYSYKFKSY